MGCCHGESLGGNTKSCGNTEIIWIYPHCYGNLWKPEFEGSKSKITSLSLPTTMKFNQWWATWCRFTPRQSRGVTEPPVVASRYSVQPIVALGLAL
jgi:hypothetical protein